MNKKNKIIVSIIIPFFNEEQNVINCLESLIAQRGPKSEIILVNDGSTDNSLANLMGSVLAKKNHNVFIFSKKHSGPGLSRNFGASKAKGKILVFLDADMVFTNDFINKLISPIVKNKVIGTYSRDEMLENPENYWARCWNIGRFAAAGVFSKSYLKTMIPNPLVGGGVFRAILKSKFDLVNGFDNSGEYTDDLSLSRKLGERAELANNAVYFHKNPGTIKEVWERAGWIGKSSDFLGSNKRKIRNLIYFSPIISLFKAMIISYKFSYFPFVIFKIVYDLSIWITVIKNL